jgi:2-amino-4-hydroxy-6-hydroxymethyldihydropteridine diphosphokinase
MIDVAIIGLGSNLGDRRATLRSAVAALAADGRCRVLASSSLHETAPLGPALHAFLNGAVAVETALDAAALLQHLLTIEVAHGRERRERWGPRTLDLDLLVAWTADGALVEHHEDGLTLPHPRITERDFVLRPLAEVLTGLRGLGRPRAVTLGRLDAEQLLERLSPDVRTLQGIVAAPDSW